MKSIGYLLTSLSVAGLLGVAVTAQSAEKSSAAATEKVAATADKPDCEEGKAGHRYGKRDHDRHNERFSRDEQAGHDGKGAPFEKILGLTDAQQKTLADAREKEQAAAASLRTKVIAAQEAIFKAADSNASDEELNKLVANSASLRAQLELGRIKMHRQLVAILTPEQKQKLSEWEAQHKPEHRERI